MFSLKKLIGLYVLSIGLLVSNFAIGKKFAARHFQSNRARQSMTMTSSSVPEKVVGDGKSQNLDQLKIIERHLASKSEYETIDPWGSRYQVLIEENKVFLISAGPDRRFHTRDDLVDSIKLPIY